MKMNKIKLKKKIKAKIIIFKIKKKKKVIQKIKIMRMN